MSFFPHELSSVRKSGKPRCGASDEPHSQITCGLPPGHSGYHFGSEGDYYFTRVGWDEEVERSIDSFEDGVGIVGQEPFEFPFVHRRWYDTLGFLAPEREVNVDSFMLYVARELKRCHAIEPFLTHTPPVREGKELDDRRAWSEAFWTPEHTEWRTKTFKVLAAL